MIYLEFINHPKLLLFTSQIFILNFIYNTYNRDYNYAWLFLLVTITSTFIYSELFISTPRLLYKLILIDKSIISCIVIYGGYIFWKTHNLSIQLNIPSYSTIPITTCITVIYMYTVGYFQNKYSFDPNPVIANISHGILHIVGSIGHLINMYNYQILYNKSILLNNETNIVMN